MFGRLPRAIDEDLGAFLGMQKKRGFRIVGSKYSPESFGNYFVDLQAADSWVRIVRDRLQYFIHTKSPDDLRKADMLRAFDDRAAFETAVLAWLDAA